jgi:hypothetical protein
MARCSTTPSDLIAGTPRRASSEPRVFPSRLRASPAGHKCPSYELRRLKPASRVAAAFRARRGGRGPTARAPRWRPPRLWQSRQSYGDATCLLGRPLLAGTPHKGLIPLGLRRSPSRFPIGTVIALHEVGWHSRQNRSERKGPMKKRVRKLMLHRETLRTLSSNETSQAAGGGPTQVPVPCPATANACAPPTYGCTRTGCTFVPW